MSEIFFKHFPNASGAVFHAFAPYRVCPIGAHVDHQHGLVSGFAINKGVDFFYQPTDGGEIIAYSENFSGMIGFSVRDEVEELKGDWGDFLRGSVWALKKRGKLWRGVRGVIKGSLPVGGLSSSASVILCYLQALAQVNDLQFDAQTVIDIAYRAEKEFVGVSVGKLDHSCEVLSRREHLLFLDTKDQSYELIKMPDTMPPFDIVIFYSGLSRRLGATFNNHVDELKAASWYLKALDGRDLGSFSDTRLRDVPRYVFDRFKDSLPEVFMRRARHFYTECERVRIGAEAFRQGDMRTYGRMSFESGRSSIDDYQTGSPYLVALYDAFLSAPGVYGGRFSGAGFKGCAVALVDPDKTEMCVEKVTRDYLTRYPELKDAYSTHICTTHDGVGVNVY